MRFFTITLISALFLSCNINQPKGNVFNSLKSESRLIDTAKVALIRLTNPSDYRQVLDTLDQGDLCSLDVARILFKNCDTDTLTRDSIFLVFNDFRNSVAGGYLENNEEVSSRLENSPSDETINQLKRRLSSYGIALNSSKDIFYLEPQSEFLLHNFAIGLTSAYREFLNIETEEQQNRFAAEGTILILTDSLTSRITRCENFIARYPQFISIRMVQDQYAQYLNAFLAGMENSRVFNPENNLLNDSARTSFEYFIAKNPQSKSAELVRDYLELLNKTNFSYTEKVDSFLLEKLYGEGLTTENKE